MPKENPKAKKARPGVSGKKHPKVAAGEDSSKANRWGCTQNAVKRYARAGGLARASQLAHGAVDRLLDKVYQRILSYAAIRAVCAGQNSVPLASLVDGARDRCGLCILGIRPKQARQQHRKPAEASAAPAASDSE